MRGFKGMFELKRFFWDFDLSNSEKKIKARGVLLGI